MDSVYRSPGAGGAEPSANDSTSDDRRVRLEGVARLGVVWLERTAATDPQRGDVIRMGALAGDLAKAADQSPAGMKMIHTLLCANCRRLNAAEGKCFGQALERCMLLNGAASS